MKTKFLRDISLNSMQVLLNQLCGLVIFYALSMLLEKNEFGQLNWSLAILLTAFGLLSGGMDQVMVRNIAAGKSASKLVSSYCFHVLITGLFFYGLLFAGRFLYSTGSLYEMLLLLGIGKLMIFFSTPFKQLANGLERFGPLFWMSTCSNLVRSVLLIGMALGSNTSLETILYIFIAGDLVELLVCLLIVKLKMKTSFILNWDGAHYRALLKESIPQLGVVFFTTAIARLDWILLGILASQVVVAEYSFAYKVFELSTLPLLVIAPILIPRFTRLFKSEEYNNVQDLFVLLRIEMIIASLTALVLNLAWIPVIDHLTDGKYGAVNTNTILILSACLPFIYFNNFCWTIDFVKGRLRMIFFIFMGCFFINLLSNFILIPFFDAEGAALAYLITLFIQSLLFFLQTKLRGLKYHLYPLFICPAAALASGMLAQYLFDNTPAIICFAITCFGGLLLLTRMVSGKDGLIIKRMMGR